MEAGSLPPPDEEAARETSLARLEERLGYVFSSRGLLEQALTHPSRAHELGELALSNERLEFLGDAVLSLVVSDLLMSAHPDSPEGELSRARSAAVNGRALAERARELGIDTAIRLGKGEEQGGGREKLSILENALEAVVGAVYLDGGLEAARRVTERHLGPSLAADLLEARDAKSRLNEALHADGAPLARYLVTSEQGPSHDREFTVEVWVGERRLGEGAGRSKRDAEQAAAARALEVLDA